MEDVDRVNQLLKALNGGKIDGEWIPGNGFHSLISFEFPDAKNNKEAIFNINSGYPVKFFVNKRTGEIKLFSATILRKQ